MSTKERRLEHFVEICNIFYIYRIKGTNHNISELDL